MTSLVLVAYDVGDQGAYVTVLRKSVRTGASVMLTMNRGRKLMDC